MIIVLGKDGKVNMIPYRYISYLEFKGGHIVVHYKDARTEPLKIKSNSVSFEGCK